MARSKKPAQLRPYFLAGNLALDFLSTRMRVGGELMDFFQSGEHVISWIRQAGLAVPETAADMDSRALLLCARKLREIIRVLVDKRKNGKRGDPSVLNRFLNHAQSHPQLLWERKGSLKISQIRREDTPEAILAPVAESAAVLLSTANFDHVKRCEDESCVLWFCDQTKSHHRRWCSVALCGNRHKVADYRKRHITSGKSASRR